MRTIVITLEGGEDVVNVDGVTIPIDDTEPRARALRQALATYIQSAKRGVRGGPLYRLVPLPPDETRTRDIRAWWRTHPEGLPEWRARGRLPKAVVDAFDDWEPPPRARGIENFDALARAALLSEAKASVALDGETICVDGCTKECAP